MGLEREGDEEEEKRGEQEGAGREGDHERGMLREN